MSLSILVTAVIILGIVAGFVTFNTLVRGRKRVDEAWAGIDVQLRRRASLLPNVAEAVRAYAGHERDVFEQVARARAGSAQPPPTPDAQADLVRAALSRLMAVAEAYPDLKASANFQQLQADVADTEDKIARARQFYNRAALDYNTRIDTVPGLLLARLLDFKPVGFFEADEDGRREVRLEFGART